MIDYRSLLIRYIAHVQQEEGHDYIPEFGSIVPFSAEEVSELNAIAEEAARLRRANPDAWHPAPK